MGRDSGIQWTNHTFNPWWGCVKVSPGCSNCYADVFDRRLGGHHWGIDADRRFFGLKHWQEPLKWQDIAAKSGEGHRVFCASMADVFEDRHDLYEERQRLWGLIHYTPNLDWLLLTKRPENIPRLLDRVYSPLGVSGLESMEEAPLPNVWLGTTVEDRKHGFPRIEALRGVNAFGRFLSVEPLLEDLGPINLSGIHWVIVGGESGAKARPFRISWARALRDQCKVAGVAFFMKQFGSNPMNPWISEGRIKLKDYHGGDMEEWPEDLRIREFPSVLDRRLR